MKKTSSGSSPQQHPHLDHLAKIGLLIDRTGKGYSRAVRKEASAELLRYRDEGLIIQQNRKKTMSDKPMTMSGQCQFESPGSHSRCMSGYRERTCSCPCHDEPKGFSGQGIIFAVIDDREEIRPGKVTTIDVIADAIEAALDAGHETSEEIARYLTTSAFQHIKDRRVRFNSVLKAGDTVGAQIVRKLINSYDELCVLAAKERSAVKKATLEAEAQGFAEAISVIMSPFSAEDADDPTLVNWEEVDRMTGMFEKERREIRAAVEKAEKRR